MSTSTGKRGDRRKYTWPASSGKVAYRAVYDGQTNSILFHWPSRIILESEDALLDTLLNTGSDDGQEIKREVILTPGYTSE
jgi:hypothetical protein